VLAFALGLAVGVPGRGAPASPDLRGWGFSALWPVLPLILAPLFAALLALALQRAFVIAPARIRPRGSRISPLSGLSRRLGRDGLAEFAKGLVKLALILVLATLVARSSAGPALTLLGAEARVLGPASVGILAKFLTGLVLVTLAIGGIDFLWQRHRHRAGLRMSFAELKQEVKDSEGDPQLKAERQRKAQSIAANRMMFDVPKASVVIVNPTHFAVALKWDRKAGRAPFCLAKGTDEVAARIREVASIAGVPIHRDPPTARSLHALVEVGAEIHPDHYRAVAAAIRFAEGMRRRARAAGL
jgi:flagellar biosynthetic protein FlhB